MSVEIICADSRDALAAMPEGSVHVCVTSPPYWGLRDYGIEPVVWGPDCEHEWGEEMPGDARGGSGTPTDKNNRGEGYGRDVARGSFCRRCDAWRGSLGLEPTPELYVEHIVQVMREIRRVLRDDGTLWLNLGDSYAGSGRGLYADGLSHGTDGAKQKTNAGSVGVVSSKRIPRGNGRWSDAGNLPATGILKPKDLCGMPWRVAFALQADGWWLRSDIVWSKPNPMPESVTDRPTRSHEYVFLLAKSAWYYYDADAIRTPAASETGKMPDGWDTGAGSHGTIHRNDREKGRRVDKQRGHGRRHDGFNDRWDQMSKDEQQAMGVNKRSVWEIATQPYAKAHFATFPEKLVEPCILAGCPEGGTVLDPFAGSGTVGLVAERLGRDSVLIDASEDYCRMARERTAQMGLMG